MKMQKEAEQAASFPNKSKKIQAYTVPHPIWDQPAKNWGGGLGPLFWKRDRINLVNLFNFNYYP
jgi:hypothetical protein